MGLRLVLVGMVAGLGLTLPSAGEVERWSRQSSAWVHELFADRRSEMPVDGSAFVLIPEPVADAAPSLPPTSTPAPAPPPANTPALASKVVETPRLEETKPTPASLASNLDAPTLPMPLVEMETEKVAVVVAEPETFVDVPKIDTIGIGDGPFLQAQCAVLALFAESALVDEARETANMLAMVEEMAAADQDRRFAAAQEATISAFAAETLAEASKIEPAKDDAKVEEDVAYALNREAEGLNLPSALRIAPEAEEHRAEDRAGRLTQAVRLTREAAYAWASLIHTPAVVTIHH